MDVVNLKTQCDVYITTQWGKKILEGRLTPALYVFEKDGQVHSGKVKVGSENDSDELKLRKKKKTAGVMRGASQDPNVEAMLLILDTEVKGPDGEPQDTLLSLLYTPGESHYRAIPYRNDSFCDAGWEPVDECGGIFGNPWRRG